MQTTTRKARILRPMGKVQLMVLSALGKHGRWYGDGAGCGWNWSTPKQTQKLLDGLVRRGLVTVTEEKLLNGRTARVYRPAPPILATCSSCGGRMRPAARIDGPAAAGECSCWQTPAPAAAEGATCTKCDGCAAQAQQLLALGVEHQLVDDNDEATQIVDVIANLHHRFDQLKAEARDGLRDDGYCADWADVLRIADYHYEAEVAGEVCDGLGCDKHPDPNDEDEATGG